MSEFYFSAAATAKAKEKGGLVKYRSYKKGTYFDKISERYNFVDIFELQAFRVPLDMEKVKWYRENTKEPLLTPSGQDGHIIGLSREAYYADQGASHVVLPMQLTAKRFQFVAGSDLELWEQESKEEGINFVGSIPAIAPVREILEKSAEDRLIHEATSDRDEQMRQAAAATTTDYEEHFFPSGPCGHFECPVCYGGLEIFNKPKIFLLGLSENAPQVISIRVKDAKTKKLKYLLRLAEVAQLSTMISQVTNSMDDIEAIDKPSYYDELQ